MRCAIASVGCRLRFKVAPPPRRGHRTSPRTPHGVPCRGGDFGEFYFADQFGLHPDRGNVAGKPRRLRQSWSRPLQRQEALAEVLQRWRGKTRFHPPGIGEHARVVLQGEQQ